MNVKPCIYLDTSVLNFLFADDAPDLKAITIELFDNFIKTGIYETYVSDFVIQEINKTQNLDKRKKLLKILEEYPVDFIELQNLNTIDELADLYIFNKIVPANKRFDALHIAVSVLHKMNYLVSWNFKHLANINRERKVLAVNSQNNYLHPIRILTPIELIDYGN